MKKKTLQHGLLSAVALVAAGAMLMAQGPAGGGQGKGGGKGGGKGPAGPVFTVTSPSFADGGEVPRTHSFYGDNKLPQFDFSWVQAGNAVAAPAALQSYAVIFHDIENATAKGPTDTLHWAAFNIPGTAKGLPEGMGTGDLPDGTRNGPASVLAAALRATLVLALAPVRSITTCGSSTRSTRSSICRRPPRAMKS